MLKKFVPFLLLAACAKPAAPAFEPAPGAVVAEVNGVALSQAELDLWAGRDPHAGALSGEAREKALEALVAKELQRQAAYKLGLHQEEAAAQKLAALRAQYLAAQRDVLVSAFHAREMADAAQEAEGEARAYFDANAARLKTEYRIFQIAYAKDPAAIADAKRALDEGQPFELVAARRFKGLPPDQRPWDLGYLRFSQLPPEWRDAVEQLETGGVSDILKGAGDRWWIIKIVDKRANDAITFESEKAALVSSLVNERIAERRAKNLENLRKNAKVTFPNP